MRYTVYLTPYGGGRIEEGTRDDLDEAKRMAADACGRRGVGRVYIVDDAGSICWDWNAVYGGGGIERTHSPEPKKKVDTGS